MSRGSFRHGLAWTVCLVFSAGCTALPKPVAAVLPRSNPQISRVAALWSEALLKQDNHPIAQGFACKVYLFDEAHRAVPVSGKFTVCAYDETHVEDDGQRLPHVKPDFSWELDEADLKDLMKKDAVGWSYSLWLPCGTPAPVERRYTLMISFTPDGGRRVFSESTLVTLPAVAIDPNSALAAQVHARK